MFVEVNGKRNVICFSDFILCDKWYTERKQDVADEKHRIVRTAARLIGEEIRNMQCDLSTYPSSGDMTAAECLLVPPLLKTFIKTVVPSQIKQSAISQCIVQAARLYGALSPLLGLSFELDRVFASKSLIAHLTRLGFAVSYDKIIRYKQSAVV